ncbi:MAG TPA: hypothetical protein VEZ70_15385 [Allosphingosinicella sp.]|nr:hypothetical protein [Allosphingosinicella sp.]
MPRYYFNIADASGLVLDDEGVELSDDGEARAMAVTGARDIVATEAMIGQVDLSWHIDVMRDGALLFRLPFADAFELSEGSAR